MESQNIDVQKNNVTPIDVARHLRDYSGDCELLKAISTPDSSWRSNALALFYQPNKEACPKVMELWFDTWNIWAVYVSETQKLTDSYHKAAVKLAAALAGHFGKTVHVEVSKRPLASEKLYLVDTNER